MTPLTRAIVAALEVRGIRPTVTEGVVTMPVTTGVIVSTSTSGWYYGAVHGGPQDGRNVYLPIKDELRRDPDTIADAWVSVLEAIRTAPVVVPIPTTSAELARHLMAEHGESTENLLEWLVSRSDPDDEREATYVDNSVLEHLQDLHMFQHDNADNVFHHTHEGELP